MNVLDKDILKGMAVVAGAAILAGCSSSKNDNSDGSGINAPPAQYGMMINLDLCIGCAACVLACKVENGTMHGVYWCNLHYKEEENLTSYNCDVPQVRKKYMPYACNHCREAECVKICPTGASHFDANDGTVTVDQDTCFGCHQCVDACPYEARKFNYSDPKKTPAYGMINPYGFDGDYNALLTPFELRKTIPNHQFHKAEKCTFCKNRRAVDNMTPACVETCVTKCRVFGRIDDKESDLNKEIERLGAVPHEPDRGDNPDPKPSFFYAGLGHYYQKK